MNTKKGLFLVGKDIDAYLSEYINSKGDIDINVDVVVLTHKDKFIINDKMKCTTNVFSLPEFINTHAESLRQMSFVEVVDILNELQNKYQLRNANRYVHIDFFRSRQATMEHKEHLIINILCIRFYLNLELHSYDFAFGELSRSAYLICYDLATFFNVEYLHAVNLGFLDGIIYTDDNFNILSFDAKREAFFGDTQLKVEYFKKAALYIENFRHKPQYNKQFLTDNIVRIKTFPAQLLNKLKNISFEIKSRKIDKKHAMLNVYVNPFVRWFKREIFEPIKANIYKKIFFKDEPLLNEDYIFFPLHVLPETTTSLFSDFLVDHTSEQGTSIEYLSKIMPVGYTLAVKEHPYMLRSRSAKKYYHFGKWYNACLISPYMNQFDLIRNSKLVLTLCGTAGIEAALLGKPVILLENSYYSYFSNIHTTHEIEHLDVEIPNLISSYKYDEKSLIRDVALLMFCTHGGIVNFTVDVRPDGISDSNLQLFVESIELELMYRELSKNTIKNTPSLLNKSH